MWGWNGAFEALDTTLSIEQFWQNSDLKFANSSVSEQLWGCIILMSCKFKGRKELVFPRQFQWKGALAVSWFFLPIKPYLNCSCFMCCECLKMLTESSVSFQNLQKPQTVLLKGGLPQEFT